MKPAASQAANFNHSRKNMHTTPFTLKQDNLYLAYAPELKLGAWGACQDEALNNLGEEIQQRQRVGQGSGEERK